MILHIVPDDKFVDSAYEIFEKVFPSQNEFMVIASRNQLKYIKNPNINRLNTIELIGNRYIDKYEFEKYSCIVVHFLDLYKKKIVYDLRKKGFKTKIIWIGWGGDYYNELIKKDLYDKRTEEVLQKIQSKKNIGIKSLLKKLFRYIVYKQINKEFNYNYIDIFSPVIYEDYELIKQKLGDFKPVYMPWNYGIASKNLISKEEARSVDGKNILVGNSADPTNNHLEILDILKNIKLNNKIIVPLSYGNLKYAEIIKATGAQYFGNRFHALDYFMPIKEYNDILSSCSICIMNHRRQQGIGNILAMLYMGAKVFMNPSNPAYDFFKRIGVTVFSIADLQEEIEKDEFLDQELIDKNRKILKEVWGEEAILEKTKNLIKNCGVSH